MSTTKKYVSLEKLGLYDEKIKAKITADDAKVLADAKEFATNLGENYDPAGSSALVQQKLDEEVLRAKAAEEVNAKAAKQAQDEVDALEGVVAGMYTNEQIDKAIEDAQTAATYDDTEVRGLITDLTNNKADKTQVATDIANAVKAEEDARKEAVTGVQSAVDTLASTHATDKKALEDAIALKADQTALQAEIERATGVEGGLEDRIETMEAFWEAAKADGDEGNVIDTLKEIQEYIAGDETGAAEMAASIKQNADDIDAVEGRMTTAEGKISTLEGEMDAVESAVATKVEQEAYNTKIAALEGEDTAIKGRLDLIEAELGDGEGSVAEQIATAKQEAINTAAGDATTKANTAESNAKAHADSLNTAMNTRVEALEAIDHEHANKELLDTYTQTEADLADAVAKKHAHDNKDVLDGITSAKVEAWDASEQNAKTYADGLNTAMDTRVSIVEAWQNSMIEASEEDINNLFK